MPYDPVMVQPMRDELARIGVTELVESEDVDRFMSDKEGTAFRVVNSVCGCAAGSARPAVAIALQQDPKPQRVATVFAGQDLDATDRARSYFSDYPPSSPSFVLFRDGELVHLFPRHQIEGRVPQEIAGDLREVFDRYCV